MGGAEKGERFLWATNLSKVLLTVQNSDDHPRLIINLYHWQGQILHVKGGAVDFLNHQQYLHMFSIFIRESEAR